MKKIACYFLILFLLLATIFDYFGRDIAMYFGMMAAEERLSLWEKVTLTKRANSGDIDAAKRLASYYGVWSNNNEESIRWTELSARLGDPVDQYNYGQHLIKLGRESEGLEWIKKSSDAGDIDARRYLKRKGRL